jgi:hypothetical protein
VLLLADDVSALQPVARIVLDQVAFEGRRTSCGSPPLYSSSSHSRAVRRACSTVTRPYWPMARRIGDFAPTRVRNIMVTVSGIDASKQAGDERVDQVVTLLGRSQ